MVMGYSSGNLAWNSLFPRKKRRYSVASPHSGTRTATRAERAQADRNGLCELYNFLFFPLGQWG